MKVPSATIVSLNSSNLRREFAFRSKGVRFQFMIRWITILSGLLALFISSQSQALTLGNIQIAGNACRHDELVQAPVRDEATGRMALPIGIYLKKESETPLARGSCNLAMTYTTEPGHRLILVDSDQLMVLRARNVGTRAQYNLEIFFAGQTGIRQNRILEGESTPKQIVEHLQNFGELATSACGESGIIRLNSSAILRGSDRGAAFTRDTDMTLLEVPCEDIRE